jgi:hypothetical protein
MNNNPFFAGTVTVQDCHIRNCSIDYGTTHFIKCMGGGGAQFLHFFEFKRIQADFYFL